MLILLNQGTYADEEIDEKVSRIALPILIIVQLTFVTV